MPGADESELGGKSVAALVISAAFAALKRSTYARYDATNLRS